MEIVKKYQNSGKNKFPRNDEEIKTSNIQAEFQDYRITNESRSNARNRYNHQMNQAEMNQVYSRNNMELMHQMNMMNHMNQINHIRRMEQNMVMQNKQM